MPDQKPPENSNDPTGPLVLMYHGTPKEKPTSKYSIQSGKFAAHLRYLRKNGWQTRLVRDLLSSESFPPKTVVLTFDDGYADNYEGALLPLLEHGMKATWFIASGSIGRHAHWMGEARRETEMLNEKQLRELASKGMEIASHTCSHPDLSSLPYEQQLDELKRSRESIEGLLGEEIVSFAYPYGRYNQESMRAVDEAGYRVACTVRPGRFNGNINPFLVPRITLFDTDSVGALARKLRFVDNDVSCRKIAGYYLKRAASRFSDK